MTTASPSSGKKLVRVFAGPNGSGKSTIFQHISDRYRCGTFVNADEIQQQLSKTGRLSLRSYGLDLPAEKVLLVLRQSSWNQTALGHEALQRIRITADASVLIHNQETSYEAAIVADLVRNLLLDEGKSFSFETVLSHPSKIEFLRRTVTAGYSCYLYFICTLDSRINVERVRARVHRGGHDVPTRKIVDRFERSLKLLSNAIQCSYRAFLFDNSERSLHSGGDANGLLFLEFMRGELRKKHREPLPNWMIRYALRPLPI